MTRLIFKRHGIVGQSAILMVIKLSGALLAFIFHLLLARKLSIQEYGLFSLVLTFLVFSGVFAKQGIEPAIVRYFAQRKSFEVQSLYVYILSFTLLNITLLGLILFIAESFVFMTLLNTSELVGLLPIIIGLTALQTWLAVNSSALRGRQFPISSMFFTGGVSHVISVVLLFFSSITTATEALTLFFYSVAAATTLSFILTKAKLKLKIQPLASFKHSGFGELYNTSRVLFVSSLASLISQQFALLMLARSVSLTELGFYSVAVKISMLMSYPLLVLNAITAPRYAKLFSEGKMSEFRKLAWAGTKVLIIIGTLLIICILAFSNQIVSTFGEQYLAAAPILIILAIGQWFNLATGSVVSILVMTGHEKIHRRNSVFSALFIMITLFIFVPINGIWAAAWLTTITMGLFNLVSLYFVIKLIYMRHAS